jgi:hypothetical protein
MHPELEGAQLTVLEGARRSRQEAANSGGGGEENKGVLTAVFTIMARGV